MIECHYISKTDVMMGGGVAWQNLALNKWDVDGGWELEVAKGEGYHEKKEISHKGTSLWLQKSK